MEGDCHEMSLLDANYSVLYPGGTRVFASRFHFSTRVWTLILIMAVFTVICLAVPVMLGFESPENKKISDGFLVCSILGDLVFLAVVYLWNNQDLDLYVERVQSGLWSEGVFVFSTGDVVIRYKSMFSKIEMEFSSLIIKEAVVQHNTLVIKYRARDQDQILECKLSGTLVLDPLKEIAECINSRHIQQ